MHDGKWWSSAGKGSRGVVGGAAVIATVFAMAACGDSDSESKATSTPAAENSSNGQLSADTLAELQAKIDSKLKRPPTMGIAEPVKSLKPGRTITHVYAQLPTGVSVRDNARDAVTTAGMKFNPVAFKPSPEGFQQAMDIALRDDRTSAIITTAGFPMSVVQKQLEEAKAKKIPVIATQPDKDDPLYESVGGPATYTEAGALQADYILSRSKGEGDVLIATISAFPTLAIQVEGFKSEWKRQCPKCKEPLTFNAPVNSLGTTFPSLLTAYLQAHRSVKWVVFTLSDNLIGVPNALKSSGLTGIKATAWIQGPQVNPMLYDDMLEAVVSLPVVEYGWLDTDKILRIFNGQSTKPNDAVTRSDSPITWLITAKGLDENQIDGKSVFPVVGNYKQEFKKLWGITE